MTVYSAVDVLPLVSTPPSNLLFRFQIIYNFQHYFLNKQCNYRVIVISRKRVHRRSISRHIIISAIAQVINPRSGVSDNPREHSSSQVTVTMDRLNSLLPLVEGGLILLVLYLGINEIIRCQARLKGLPGPRGLPVVGNLPQVSEHRTMKLVYTSS